MTRERRSEGEGEGEGHLYRLVHMVTGLLCLGVGLVGMDRLDQVQALPLLHAGALMAIPLSAAFLGGIMTVHSAVAMAPPPSVGLVLAGVAIAGVHVMLSGVA